MKARPPRALILTLVAEIIVVALNWIVGSIMTGETSILAFFYFLILGGGVLFFPFFGLSLLYCWIKGKMRWKLPSGRTNKGQLLYGCLILVAVACLTLQITIGIYLAYFFIMIVTDELSGPSLGATG